MSAVQLLSLGQVLEFKAKDLAFITKVKAKDMSFIVKAKANVLCAQISRPRTLFPRKLLKDVL